MCNTSLPSMSEQEKRWDIFCKIVDNYGDIGVCWRLSRQLAREHGLAIRLFIDDFNVASKLIAGLQENAHHQVVQGQIIEDVEIVPWSQAEQMQPASIVLETFNCELPTPYLEKMASAKSACINVEYLSAEPWVNDFHARPSQHPTLKLTKYYFFPGFTEQTGGLIREQELIEQRNAFLADLQTREDFWQKIGVHQVAPLNISLFGYPQADVKDFLTVLLQSSIKVNVLVPFGSILEALTLLYPLHDFSVGSVLRVGALTLYVLPFLSQDDYDRLLWACDVNFVRGEDSWIRAIWAGKPFIWQPYIQTENTHLVKLKAFLDCYLQEASLQVKQCLCNAHYAWSALEDLAPQPGWQTFFAALPKLKQYAEVRSQTFASHPDLATKLVIFSKKIQRNQV